MMKSLPKLHMDLLSIFCPKFDYAQSLGVKVRGHDASI